MSSVALAPTAVSRPAINPWIVAIAVVIPTFMEVLDTTIANVALRYIAGGLSAAVIDSEWVLTSYLAANATILPISGWLSAHLGRRNYFLLSIAVFTIASGLCGMATSLGQIILFRVIQGLAGGGLQPSSQGVLLDAFPPEKQGAAQTMFGVAALLAPVVGPTLGGYLTVQYDWRWIFYINLPVGALALLMCYFVVDDPDYLKKERAELRRRPLNFDYIGLGLLALVMSCWEIMLSKGQEWDWLGDPFWRVQTLLILFVLGLGCLIFREMRIGNPVVNFRVAGRAQLGGLLHHHLLCLRRALRRQHVPAGPAPVPVWLRRLRLGTGAVALRHFLHHDVAGCRHSPRSGHRRPLADRRGPARHGGRLLLDGADEPVHQPVAGGLAARGDDRRPVDDLRSAQRGRLQIHPPTPARGSGRPVRPAPQRGRQRRHVDGPDHSGTPRAVPPVAPGRHSSTRSTPTCSTFCERGQAFFLQQTGDPAGSQQMAVQALADLRQQQAASLAYFDVFWVCAVLGVALVLSGAAHEALGGREGRPRRRRVDPMAWRVGPGIGPPYVLRACSNSRPVIYANVVAGCFHGPRYGRCNRRVASGSPVTCRWIGS